MWRPHFATSRPEHRSALPGRILAAVPVQQPRLAMVEAMDSRDAFTLIRNRRASKSVQETRRAL